MESMILQADVLNLPEIFAIKIRGKKLELTEDGDIITIKPVRNKIAVARGMLKGGNFGTIELLEQKRMEKDLEYGC